MAAAGMRAAVFGISNTKSIGWGVAQSERFEDRVTRMAQEAGMNAQVLCCDVADDTSVQRAAESVGSAPVHALVHSVAFAPAAAMKSPFSHTSRSDFATAMDISVYSLIALTAAFLPHLKRCDGHTSVQALTYIGSTRAVPDYAVMGPCKAALEASVRQLAAELGPYGVTANSISAGPMNTLAARGISNFSSLAADAQRRQMRPGATVTPADVGAMSVFLGSPGAAAVTGQSLFVDHGFSAAL